MNVRSTFFFSILLLAMLVYSATSSSATGEQRVMKLSAAS
jgi:hypothetical protein